MLSENIDIMIAESSKKARVQGFEQGLEQGEKRANADTCKTMVTIRFGSVPDHIAAQIDAASAAQLREWNKRLFIENNIEAVFGSN